MKSPAVELTFDSSVIRTDSSISGTPGITRPVRVAHLVSHPIQYFAPLYRELAARPEIDLTVYFFSDETSRSYFDSGFDRDVAWDVDLLGGYRHVFPASSRSTRIGGPFWHRRNFDLASHLLLRPPDVVWAHGYGHLTTWLSFAAARLRGTPFLLREEQNLVTPRPRWRRAVKTIPLRILLAAAYGLAIGEANRRYLRHYGLDEHRIFRAPYCVDNDAFRQQADRLESTRDEIRATFGITDDAPVFLFVGKLEPKKNVRLLLDAFEIATRDRRAWLMLVGDGPLASDLLARSGERVLMPGFLGQSELARAYTAADTFVLPSAYAETWGLVVNEAMNFGLPVVVTDRVGCTDDLVANGANGFVVPHDRPEPLAAALRLLIDDPLLRRQLGVRSREIVSRYTISTCADGIVAAAFAAATRRGLRCPEAA